MRVSSWNADGLKKGPVGQPKANWLLTYLDSNPDIAVLAIQETHCQDVTDMAQAIHDMELKYTVIHSPATDGNEYAGIMLVISKDFVVEATDIRIQGRIMRIRLRSTIYQTYLDIINIYGFPAGRQPWIHEVTDAVDSPVPTVIVGDFNFVREARDRISNAMMYYDEQQTMSSNGFFEALDLQDTFRLVHGDKIDFSYGNQSRIDRIYVNEALHGNIKNYNHISVLGRELDHKMIEIEIAEDIEIGKGYWKFNTSLLRDKEYTEMIKNTIREEKEELHSGV